MKTLASLFASFCLLMGAGCASRVEHHSWKKEAASLGITEAEATSIAHQARPSNITSYLSLGSRKEKTAASMFTCAMCPQHMTGLSRCSERSMAFGKKIPEHRDYGTNNNGAEL